MLSLGSSLLSFACVLTLKGLSPVSCAVLILSHESWVGIHGEGLAINAGFLSLCGFQLFCHTIPFSDFKNFLKFQLFSSQLFFFLQQLPLPHCAKQESFHVPFLLKKACLFFRIWFNWLPCYFSTRMRSRQIIVIIWLFLIVRERTFCGFLHCNWKRYSLYKINFYN